MVFTSAIMKIPPVELGNRVLHRQLLVPATLVPWRVRGQERNIAELPVPLGTDDCLDYHVALPRMLRCSPPFGPSTAFMSRERLPDRDVLRLL